MDNRFSVRVVNDTGPPEIALQPNISQRVCVEPLLAQRRKRFSMLPWTHRKVRVFSDFAVDLLISTIYDSVIDSLVDPDQSAETFDMSIYDPGTYLGPHGVPIAEPLKVSILTTFQRTCPQCQSLTVCTMIVARWLSSIHAPAELPNTGYIKLVYHPHSKRSPRIIDLAVPVALPTCSTRTTSPEDPPPWNPFPSYADFDFAEAVTIDGLSNVSIDKYLSKINGTWSETSKLNIKNSADVKSYLTEAAAPYAQVCVVHSHNVLEASADCYHSFHLTNLPSHCTRRMAPIKTISSPSG